MTDLKKKLSKEATLCRIGVALGFLFVVLGLIPLPFHDAIPLEVESRPRFVQGMLIMALGLYLIIGCLIWMKGRSGKNNPP